MNSDLIKDQVTGSIVNELNKISAEKIQQNVLQQNIRFAEALTQVENVRSFINNPSHILGSDMTKHGEIAEQMEVGFRNARAILDGIKPTATFDNIGRTAPSDYSIDGVDVQSKFINGTNNTLRHVLEHNRQYNFAKNGFYHVPKDQLENMQSVLGGKEVEGLSTKSINAIKQNIRKLEQESQKSFNDVVKPSINDYSGVQVGKAHETISKEEYSLTQKNNAIIQSLERKDHLAEGLKATGTAAVLQGGISLAVSVYKKCKQGKRISDFTTDDFKDIGLDTLKGTAKGAVTGLSIYALTNFANVAAPMASSIVSATFGVAKLYGQYSSGEMTLGEFILQSESLCFETALVGIGSAIGQTLIPIPVVGSIVGSIVTSILIDVGKNYLGNDTALVSELNRRNAELISKLSTWVRKQVLELTERFNQLGGLVDMAFDVNLNSALRFDNSIKLAVAYGVSDSKILKTAKDIDDYFLK